MNPKPASRCSASILTTALSFLLFGFQGCASHPHPRAWSADFSTYAVAADHHLASQAGAEILAAGGNAVDAAVATSFTLSVVRPFSCGIGGGGFMVIAFPDSHPQGPIRTAFNYRETAPTGVDQLFYIETKSSSLTGATAAGVPGTVAGLLAAHEKYGVLDRAMVLAPAIRTARAGFVVDEAFLGAVKSATKRLSQDPDLQRRFSFFWERYAKRGTVKLGDRITNPEQAHTLELIAEHGSDAFYRGQIAEAIVEAVRADGGMISSHDLEQYTVREIPPLEFDYRGNRVLTMPPPSSGGVALAQIAGLYERLIDRWPDSLPEVTAHLYAEASAHAFADRAKYLADTDFVHVPVQLLISEEYLDTIASRISLDHPLTKDAYDWVTPPPDDSGTSHVSIVDAHGGAVTCTETINTSFGSLLAVPGYGFILNNEMDDFTTFPSRANTYGLIQSARNLPEPGKRPLSSMTPTIVLDESGHPVLLTGASGGPRIISAVAQTLLVPNPLGGGGTHDLDQPRIHHQWVPFALQHEPSVPPSLLDSLRARGHELTERTDVGVAQTIRRISTPTGTVWRAQSDPRKGGKPAGQ